MNFLEKISNRFLRTNSHLCIGLDPDPQKIPEPFGKTPDQIFHFLDEVIEATSEYALALKPNLAYFEALGLEGIRLFEKVLKTIPEDIPVIADAKRGDIGNSAKHYANAFFNHFNCDAITVNPYMGADSIEPFCSNPEKGVYVLCVTSNPSASKIQDDSFKNVIDLTNNTNQNENVGLVVGATKMEKMEEVRALSRLPFLIPGIGVQGGDLENTIKINEKFIESTLINVSRSIIFADDISAAAKEFLEQMRGCIER